MLAVHHHHPGRTEGRAGLGLVAAELELDDDYWQVSLQSRVGREEWLRPYTDDVLKTWGGEKLARMDVISPGFSADCLETLEEIEILFATRLQLWVDRLFQVPAPLCEIKLLAEGEHA